MVKALCVTATVLTVFAAVGTAAPDANLLLVEAAKARDLPKVRALIKEKVDVNARAHETRHAADAAVDRCRDEAGRAQLPRVIDDSIGMWALRRLAGRNLGDWTDDLEVVDGSAAMALERRLGSIGGGAARRRATE